MEVPFPAVPVPAHFSSEKLSYFIVPPFLQPSSKSPYFMVLLPLELKHLPDSMVRMGVPLQSSFPYDFSVNPVALTSSAASGVARMRQRAAIRAVFIDEFKFRLIMACY